MAIVFYVLGTLGAIVGTYGTALAIYAGYRMTSAASQVDTGGTYYVTGMLPLALPAIAIIVAGLLLLGIGGVLRRLDKIVHYNRLTYQLARQGGTATTGQPQP